MNPREAEKLLGGYATGTLSEAERKALFAAALEDQALFDALADEESLRDLLADPAARARLLAALEPPKVRPLWRRPAAMSLAASLIAAVGVGILLKHTKAPEIQRELVRAAPKVESAPEAPQAPSMQAEADARPVATAKPAPSESLRMKKAEAPPPPPPPPPPSQQPSAMAGAPAPMAMADAAPAAPEPKAEASNEASRARAHLREDKAAPGAQAGGIAGSVTAPPVWTWSGHGDARLLSVTWGPDGVLTLVVYRSDGNREIKPWYVAIPPDGPRRSVFRLPENSPPAELFWTPRSFPVQPMEAPTDGFRSRILSQKP